MSLPRIRALVDRLVGGLIVLCVSVAAIPVLVLLLFVLINGLPGMLTPGFLTDPPYPQGVPGGGVLNAIIGTLEIVGIGSLLAVPVGALIGIFLSEYGRNQIGNTVRFISDVFTGLPSIAFGIFGYTVVVLTTHHFSALSGSIALAVLMLPVILRATETALVLLAGDPGNHRPSGTGWHRHRSAPGDGACGRRDRAASFHGIRQRYRPDESLAADGRALSDHLQERARPLSQPPAAGLGRGAAARRPRRRHQHPGPDLRPADSALGRPMGE